MLVYNNPTLDMESFAWVIYEKWESSGAASRQGHRNWLQPCRLAGWRRRRRKQDQVGSSKYSLHAAPGLDFLVGRGAVSCCLLATSVPLPLVQCEPDGGHLISRADPAMYGR